MLKGEWYTKKINIRMGGVVGIEGRAIICPVHNNKQTAVITEKCHYLQ
jgi:hypothetical protein